MKNWQTKRKYFEFKACMKSYHLNFFPLKSTKFKDNFYKGDRNVIPVISFKGDFVILSVVRKSQIFIYKFMGYFVTKKIILIFGLVKLNYIDTKT